MQFHQTNARSLAAAATMRLRTIFIWAFSGLKRQPQIAYDVRANKRADVFNVVRAKLFTLFRAGMSTEGIITGLGELAADVKTWDGSLAVLAPREAHIREMSAEGSAHAIVAVAVQSDRLEDLERAIFALQMELEETEGLLQSLRSRAAIKRACAAQRPAALAARFA